MYYIYTINESGNTNDFLYMSYTFYISYILCYLVDPLTYMKFSLITKWL